MKVCWLSGGVSSFMAAYLAKNLDRAIYIHIEDQHPDTLRFIADCSKALRCETTILYSTAYKCVEDAIRSAGVIRMPWGYAPCTSTLKMRVRKEWEARHDCDITYVWGYDCNEKHRAERTRESMPEFTHEFPLIENNLTKQDAHGMLAELCIKRPAMYDMGYLNNNCIGCIKGGIGYWNKIRRDFPDVFNSRAKMEREVGHSILKECYLDELSPDRGRNQEPICESCSIMCQLALEGDTNE